MLPGILVFGLGVTLTVSPLTSAILGVDRPARSGIASAVNNAVSRVAGPDVIAMLAVIVGGSLNLNGVHRAMIAAAALLILGGVVSFLGIRNPVHDEGCRRPPESGAPAVAPAASRQPAAEK